MAGANSIFYGCKLLTTPNPETDTDMQLFKRLGINAEKTRDYSDEAHEAILLEAVQEKQEEKLFYDAAH